MRPDGCGRPTDDGIQTRCTQGKSLLKSNPTPLVVLRTAEFRTHGKGDSRSWGLRHVVASDLLVAVRGGLPVALTPAELQGVDQRLLLDLTNRSLKWLFSAFDYSLGKIPIAISAQHQVTPGALELSDDDDPRR